MAFIEVSCLTKEFEHREKGLWGTRKKHTAQAVKTAKIAVDGISFSVERGECVGYIGPNGAGKSTTIRMLSGILYPTSGEASVGGMVPWRERQRFVKRAGMMFGNRNQLWPELTPLQSFDLLRTLYEIEKGTYRRSLDYLVETLSIEPLLNRPLREFSLGQRMLCELASVFLHEPEIVFLDEPTIGLDFKAKMRMREIISSIRAQRNVTIMYTSHDLREVEQTCDRLIVIDKGRICYEGSITADLEALLTGLFKPDNDDSGDGETDNGGCGGSGDGGES